MSDISTNSTYVMALEYTRRGWPVIAVHGVTDAEAGICTCGKRPCGRDNAMAGKHPVYGGWQRTPMMSVADAYATWEQDGPDWNVGILTGDPSGIFVLDIDPGSGGRESLRELESRYGELATYMVETGSGGLHYYFTMPDFPVRNNVHRLGAGIDVRGTGGMVIAPPSISGMGSYDLARDHDPVPAPRWLLDLLTMPAGFSPSPGVAAEDLPEWADLGAAEQSRLNRYASAVLESEAETYRNAPPGRGNELLFSAACNMLEVVQSPWNLLTSADAVRHLEAARQTRNLVRVGGGQDDQEFRQTFRSAQNKVVGQGRPVPPDRTEGLMFDHPTAGVVATDDDATDPGDGLMFDPGGAAVVIAPAPTQLDRLRARLHTRSQLEGIMPPTPLIEGVMDVGSMVVLAGQFGSFKTFTTIGWACAVATGEPWLGHEVVTPGPVLYVAAEGASGIKLRVRAWEAEAGVRVPDDRFYVLDIPVNLGSDEQCTAALTIAREIGAVLVVFDTLHRCTPGLDENDSGDMGRITMVADVLREHAGAATLYVHHTGHAGTRSRGASSIEDDADCVWVAGLINGDSRDPARPRALEQRKTKDSPLLERFFVRLELIEGTDSGVLALVTEEGVVITNGVAGADPFIGGGQPTVDLAAIQARIDAETNDGAALVLNVFADTFHEHASGVTKATVKAVCKAAYKDRVGWNTHSFPRTFERAWGRLQVGGIIEEGTGGRWLVVPIEDRTG